MMDERLEEQAGLYVLGGLTPAESHAFEATLARDAELQLLVAGWRSVRDAISGAVPPATPPPYVKQRLLAELEAREKKSLPPPAPAAADFMAFWLPWAITAVVVVLAVNWYMDKRDLKTLALRQKSRIEELDELADSLRATTNSLQQTIATLTAASKVDDVRIALLASPLAGFPKPQAVSLWDNPQQTGIFVAQNLPPLAPDRDYQLWIVDPQYLTPVNAGVFQPDSQGAVRLHIKPDKAIATADRFTVTTEPKGGSETPTFKNMVLVGGGTESLQAPPAKLP